MPAKRTQFTKIVSGIVIVCILIGLTPGQFLETSATNSEEAKVNFKLDQTSSTIGIPVRKDKLINQTVSGPLWIPQGNEMFVFTLGLDVSRIVAYMECTSEFDLDIWGPNADWEATFPADDNLTIRNPPSGNYNAIVSWHSGAGTYNLTLLVYTKNMSTTSTSEPSSSQPQTNTDFLQDLWNSLIGPAIVVVSLTTIGVVVILFAWHRYRMRT